MFIHIYGDKRGVFEWANHILGLWHLCCNRDLGQRCHGVEQQPWKMGGKIEISIARLKNGFYYIHIFNKEGILSEKIRIQR